MESQNILIYGGCGALYWLLASQIEGLSRKTMQIQLSTFGVAAIVRESINTN
ncbi:MAG: hypothetical protein KDK76_01100 [Chlamydiia bacterium]|nr:hypothetical protein [Chlamydiia bacterium]